MPPYIGGELMPLDNTPSVEDRVLEMQAAGYLPRRIAVNLGIDVLKVRSIAKRHGRPFGSLAAYKAARTDNRPMSRELVDALMSLPPHRCMYIERHVHDPEARPCGEACYAGAWCERHYHVVYTRDPMEFLLRSSKLKSLPDMGRPLRSKLWRRR